MKTLIIPDIHTDYIKAEEMIAVEKPDKVVFLGDYFDDWEDTLESTEQTALWLKTSLEDKNRTHLLGNHDLSYLYPTYRCAGFSEGKQYVINKTGVDLKQLKSYCWVDDYLCTHAGLSDDFYNAYKHRDESITEFLEADFPALYNCSSLRGGLDRFSGIYWCDYNEFVDIPHVNQIFGHTNGKYPRYTGGSTCLDTRLRYYAVHDKELKIKSTV